MRVVWTAILLLVQIYIIAQSSIDAQIEDALETDTFKDKIEKLYQLKTNLNLKTQPLKAALLAQTIAETYRKNKLYKEAIVPYLNSIKFELSASSPNDSLIVARSYELGRSYARSGQKEKAFPIFRNIIANDDGSLAHFYAYEEMGLLYYDEEAYYKAIDYFQLALNKSAQCPVEHQLKLKLDIIIDICDTYLVLGKNDEAKNNLDLGRKMLQANSNNDPFILSRLYSYYSNFYYEIGDLNASIEYEIKALDYEKLKPTYSDKIKADKYNNIGLSYLDLSNLDKAKYYLNEAEIIFKSYGNAFNLELGHTYFNLADVYSEEKDYKASLNFYGSAVRQYCSLKSSVKNPFTFDHLKTSVDLSETLNLLIQRHRIINQELKSFTDLDKINSIMLMDSLIQHIQTNYQDKKSFLFWRKKAHRFYKKACTEALNMQKIELAFYFSEKNKGLLLHKLVVVSAVNSSVDSSLKLSIDANESKIQNLEKQVYLEADLDLKNELNAKLLESKNDYYADLESLKRRHPQYYQTAYNVDFVTLQEIQKKLPSNLSFVEYFVLDQETVVFYANKDTLGAIRINDTDHISEKINGILAEIKSFGKSGKESKTTTIKDLKDLYDVIWKPASELLTEDVIIVRDHVLNFLPFEILFDGDKYLIEGKNLMYQFSGTIWSSTKSGPRASQHSNILAFAPSFGQSTTEDRSNLGQLLYNVDEVNAISKVYPSKKMLSEDASLVNFKSLAPLYPIIHLSTHSFADADQSQFSYIAFKNPSNDLEGKLYVTDLYQMDLSAELVVLSSCETAVGQINEGEGVLSLTHGFFYAGAKNIVSSQWSVDDRSTFDIMPSFYAKLKEGLPKYKALSAAKRDYLKSAPNALRHPYYWGSFVYYGDNTSLNKRGKSSSTKHMMYLIFGSVLSIFLVYRYRSIILKSMDLND